MNKQTTAEQVNKILKGSPYFAINGSRSIKYYKRYNFTTTNEGYKVGKPEVERWLARAK